MKALPLLVLALAACTPASAPPADPATPSASPTAATAAVTAAPTPPPAPAASVAAPAPTPADVPASDPLVGQTAPDFTATAQNGKAVHIAALSGKQVVVYFYPKDETPGCTKEACSFRDAWTALGKTGAVLVGVSADSLDSHKAFVAHYKLPFLLVSDPDGSIGKKYGVPFEGHHQRQTIVIGADGKVRKVYRKVDVAVHAQEILADVTG
jgi:thioredoxin-dependent peroxiredoxin